MSEPIQCPECGAAIPTDVLAGVCPRCAARAALAASSLLVHPSTLTPPRVRYVGDYELLEEIGRGGMGVVYRARQVSLNRLVAVKMLAEGAFASDEAIRRFRTEAESAANLQHPNIVAIHETGQHDGQYYFSMDYVEGPNLAELTEDGPLTAERAARYVQIIAGAIHHAHQRGILHRDLKPSNVLIDAFDQPRITDFGLAKRLPDKAQSPKPKSEMDLTLSGQVLGTPSYISPEQAGAKRGQIGVASDVYALGAILYHLLTGHAPFAAQTLGETLVQVQASEPKSPRSINPSVPRDLEAICLMCLRKDSRDRYASALELADDLGRWARRAPIAARAAHRLGWPQRRIVLAGWIAFAALLALLGLVWHLKRSAGATGREALPRQGHNLPITAAIVGSGSDTNRSQSGLGLAGRILFSYRPKDSLTFDLWLINADGTGLTNLTQTPELDEFEPAVNPDASRVAFLCWKHANPTNDGLWTMRFDGTSRCLLVSTMERKGPLAPVWLDNRRVAYTASGNAVCRQPCFARNVEQSREELLFSLNSSLGLAAGNLTGISPDRTRFAVCAGAGAWAPAYDVYIVTANGRNGMAVYEDAPDNWQDEAAKWSPRDDTIAFSHWLTPGAYNSPEFIAVATVKTNGSDFRLLTASNEFCRVQDWSPDGRCVLFMKSEYSGTGVHYQNQGNLWALEPETGRRQQITRLDGWFPLAAPWGNSVLSQWFACWTKAP